MTSFVEPRPVARQPHITGVPRRRVPTRNVFDFIENPGGHPGIERERSAAELAGFVRCTQN